MSWYRGVMIAPLAVAGVLVVGIGRPAHIQSTVAPAITSHSGRVAVILRDRFPFRRPVGIAFDRHGHVYIADWGNARILKLSPSGRILGHWPAPGWSAPRIAVDQQGNIYVAETGAERLMKISASGRVFRQWGPKVVDLAAVAIDAHNQVYAAGDGVRLVSKDGQRLTYWPLRLPARALAVDARGDIYVSVLVPEPKPPPLYPCTPPPGRICPTATPWIRPVIHGVEKIFASGRRDAQWGSERSSLEPPNGITVDAHDDVYVVRSQEVRKLSPQGRNLLVWGTSGGGAGQFTCPSDISVDPHGNVYVVDTGNNRIQKFSPKGELLAVWQGERGGTQCAYSSVAKLLSQATAAGQR